MNNREEFLDRLQANANPKQVFSSQGIMMNRIVREHKPENKILPRTGQPVELEIPKKKGINLPQIPSFEERKLQIERRNLEKASEKDL